MDSEPRQVRDYRSDDLRALYRICLQTADNGDDATAKFQDLALPGAMPGVTALALR